MPGASGDLSALRQEFYRCLLRRVDALFELPDAVLCTDGPVRSVAELSVTGEPRRGMAAAGPRPGIPRGSHIAKGCRP